MRFIKNTLLLCIFGYAGFFLYGQKDAIKDFAQQNINRFIPCSYPLTYSLGRIDERFQLKETDILKHLEESENLWETSAGKELFQHVETGGTLTINFIYDTRQEITNSLKVIDTEIDADEITYNELKEQYDSLMKEYGQGKADLAREASALEKRRRTYQSDVDSWNARGGAPAGEYEKLGGERNKINSIAANLNARQAQLNQTAKTINTLADELNGLVDKLQLNVERFNTTASAHGEEFDEGEYIRDTSGQRINIYEFRDNVKLLRVLTHEMGHALGMDHVDDENAIMYRTNQSDRKTLTDLDMEALKGTCRL